MSPLVSIILCPGFLLHLLANLLLRLYAVFNKDKRLLVSVLAIGVVLLCVDGVSSLQKRCIFFQLGGNLARRSDGRS